jgi:hypothetical protein
VALQIGCWLTEPAKNRDGRANEPFVSKAKTSVRSSSALNVAYSFGVSLADCMMPVACNPFVSSS